MQTKLTFTLALAAVTQAISIGDNPTMTMTQVNDNQHGPIHVPKGKSHHGQGHHHHPQHKHLDTVNSDAKAFIDALWSHANTNGDDKLDAAEFETGLLWAVKKGYLEEDEAKAFFDRIGEFAGEDDMVSKKEMFKQIDTDEDTTVVEPVVVPVDESEEELPIEPEVSEVSEDSDDEPEAEIEIDPVDIQPIYFYWHPVHTNWSDEDEVFDSHIVGMWPQKGLQSQEYYEKAMQLSMESDEIEIRVLDNTRSGDAKQEYIRVIKDAIYDTYSENKDDYKEITVEAGKKLWSYSAVMTGTNEFGESGEQQQLRLPITITTDIMEFMIDCAWDGIEGEFWSECQ